MAATWGSKRMVRWALALAMIASAVLTTGLPVPSAQATSFPAGAMIIEVDLSRGSGGKVLQFQLDGYGQVTVDWDADNDLGGAVSGCDTTHGDGNRQVDLWDEVVRCDYPDASTSAITVAISGSMDPNESFTFRIVSGAEMVTEVVQWGNSLWTAQNINFEEAFQWAVNLTSVPSTIPTGVRKTKAMFRWATSFNADISGWDTSQVTEMRSMFEEATAFNQDIGAWDVGNVWEMAFMFKRASAFNQDIGCWDTSSAQTFEGMFEEASAFNQDINYKATGTCVGAWDTSDVTDMRSTFKRAASFNRNIGGWDTGSVTEMRSMFEEANVFNQDIGAWDTGLVRDMAFVFKGASVFNQNIGCWDTGSAQTLEGTFEEASAFNQDINYKATGTCVGAWDTSDVTDMRYTFKRATAFNQNIGGWDTGSVTEMRSMFEEASVFNQDIGAWDTGLVREMAFMFKRATAFNQDIGCWNTGSAQSFEGMFEEASSFNQDIDFKAAGICPGGASAWDTGSVWDMRYMFKRATSFAQNIDDWNLFSVTHMEWMFEDVTLPTNVYSNIVTSWSSQSLRSNIAGNGGFHGGFSTFDCTVTTEWQTLEAKVGSITDGGQVPCAPLTPVAIGDATSATVSWTAPSGLAPTGYTVTASPGGATCTTVAPITTCDVTGLTPGTAYTFSVIALTANGDSDPALALFTTSGATSVVLPPPAPTTSPKPAPAPVPTDGGALPVLRPGTSEVFIAGEPETVEMLVEDSTDLVMRGQNFELRLSDECTTDCRIQTDAEGREVLTLERSGKARVQGRGFLAGTPVYVWLFSEPRLLGELTVQADGTFAGVLALGDIAVGQHTLQVNGTSFDGKARTANLGVVVLPQGAPTPAPGVLPATGTGTGLLAWVVLLTVLGGALTWAGRRRTETV